MRETCNTRLTRGMHNQQRGHGTRPSHCRRAAEQSTVVGGHNTDGNKMRACGERGGLQDCRVGNGDPARCDTCRRHGEFARPTLTKPHLIFFPPSTDASSRRRKRRRAEAAVPIDSRSIMALGAFTGALPVPPLTPRHWQAALTANTNTPYSTDWSEYSHACARLRPCTTLARNHSLLLSWPRFRAITA
jgi:hypothetical protein